jgi:hypothetical protein
VEGGDHRREGASGRGRGWSMLFPMVKLSGSIFPFYLVRRKLTK